MDSLASGTDDTIQIICGHSSWVLDTARICAVSEIMKKELASGMQEGHTQTIHHKEFDEVTVGRMIAYITTGHSEVKQEVDHELYRAAEKEAQAAAEQTERASEDTDEDIPHASSPVPFVNEILLSHTAVSGIAEYYEIDSLQEYASKRFATAGELGWQPIGFSKLVKAVYRVSWRINPSLRYTLAEYAAKYRAVIMSDTSAMRELAVDTELQQFLASLFSKSVWLEILNRSRQNQIIERKEFDFMDARTAMHDLMGEVHSVGNACYKCNSEFPRSVTIREVECPLDEFNRLGLGKYELRCEKCDACLFRATHPPRTLPSSSYLRNSDLE